MESGIWKMNFFLHFLKKTLATTGCNIGSKTLLKWHLRMRIKLFATLAPPISRTVLITPPPPLFILHIQRGSDIESLCKVWWSSYCGVFFEWTFNFWREICKFSATLAPPILTGWLVTPFLFWISKGNPTRIVYAKFYGIPIVGYILNEFK